MIRGSTMRPTIAIASAGSMSRPVIVSGAFVFQRRFSMLSPFNVNTVNMNITVDVDDVNTKGILLEAYGSFLPFATEKKAR